MGKRVLVVEDDLDIQESLKFLLEEEGCRVRTAANGLEALRTLQNGEEPSLILLDLMMPVMSGWEFLERVRLDPRLAQIPIVVVTAAGEQKETPAGAQRLLRKPLQIDSLLKIVHEYCHNGSGPPA